MKSWQRWAMGLAAAAVCGTTAWGQWRTQDFQLRPGWNSVAVQVRPTTADFATLLGEHTNDVEEIWRWSKAFTSAEFTTDESKLLPKSAHWDVWVQGEESFLSTMAGFVCGQSYMVKLKDDSPGFTFSLKGRAALPRQTWYPNALNLVGGCVATNGTSFAEWFAGADPEIDLSNGYRNEAYKVNADGKETQIVRPALQKIDPNEAVWVFCNGAKDWTGPIEVTTDCATGIGGLDFGNGRVATLTLTVENQSPNGLEVTLSVMDSASAPAGEEQVAGRVPLYYQKTDETGLKHEWEAFPESQSRWLDPGAKWTILCGVKRTEMLFREDMSETNSSYQSLLRVRATRDLDHAGAGEVMALAGARQWDVADILCPVRAVRAKDESLPWMLGGGDAGSVANVHSQKGLWIGEALVDAVNCPGYAQWSGEGDDPLPVVEPMSIRLLAYVDGEGNACLMQEAWIVQDAGGKAGLVVCPDRATAEGQARLLEQNGCGVEVNRISASMFPQGMAPLALQRIDNAGEVATTGLAGTLTATVDLAYDAPSNPFMHRYHPMFDNLDGHFGDTVKESKDVRRVLKLVLTPIGEKAVVGGEYFETVTGLRAAPIKAKGQVVLQKVLAGVELVLPDAGN